MLKHENKEPYSYLRNYTYTLLKERHVHFKIQIFHEIKLGVLIIDIRDCIKYTEKIYFNIKYMELNFENYI